MFETGEVQQLLNIGGTIPIVYKEETYNIPIKVGLIRWYGNSRQLIKVLLQVWILKDYPRSPPFCYILPTKDRFEKGIFGVVKIDSRQN